MALTLFAGTHHSQANTTSDELLQFCTEVRGVARSRAVWVRIAEAMYEVPTEAKGMHAYRLR